MKTRPTEAGISDSQHETYPITGCDEFDEASPIGSPPPKAAVIALVASATLNDLLR